MRMKTALLCLVPLIASATAVAQGPVRLTREQAAHFQKLAAEVLFWSDAERDRNFRRMERIFPSIRVAAGHRGLNANATWTRSADRQSGVYGYWVQRLVNGRWITPVFADYNHLTVRVGRGHGKLRVQAEDWAGNRSAWSGAARY